MAWIATGAAMLAGASPAQATPADPPARIAAAAQDLATALDSLARRSRMQILYPYAVARGRRVRAPRDPLPVRDALHRLIDGSGLEIAYASDRVVVLRVAAATPVVARARPPRQVVPPAPEARAPLVSEPAPDVVVTGRAAASPVGETQLSYAVTRISPTELARKGPISTASLFRDIPGFWVESSGGEASNNVRSRGIPTDGYSSVALIEDGLPVQYDGGLGYQNTDQVFRIDSTIERVEAVRGGPSAIFTPNAPGGSVNFITRGGLRDPGYTLSATLGGAAYRRVDGYAGFRVTPHLGLSLGGFYREDRGLRDPGFPADRGGQVRAAVDYERDGLRLTFNVKRLDDRVILYLPVPLRSDAAGAVRAIPGFDPLYDTLAGPDEVHVPFRTAQGRRDFDLSRGTRSRVTFYTLGARKAWEDGTALELKLRLRTGTTTRDGLFPIGRPMTQADYVASVLPRIAAAYPDTAAIRLLYASGGQPVPVDSNGNGLLVGANLLSVAMPMRELIGDVRVTRAVDGWGHHDLAAGATYDDTRLDFARTMGTVLLDVRGQARRVDVLAVDAGGRRIGALTDNGFIRYGSLFDDATLRPSSIAFYLADEWRIAPHWRIDLGARWERVRIGGEVQRTTAVDLGDPATLADDAVLTGVGVGMPFRRRFAGFNWTIGTNYSVSAGTGLFARFTRIARLPSASEFIGDPGRSDEATVPILMAEAGVTLRHRRWNLSAVGFQTRFTRLPFTDYRFDSASSAYVSHTAIADTATWGVEVSGHASLIGPLQVDLMATWQDPRYRNFRFVDMVDDRPVTRDYTGRQLIRVPLLALRLTPALDLLAGRLRIAADVTRYSRRFADIANTQPLPSFAMIGMTVTALPADHLKLTVQADNLTNALGLTEGNPRAGSFDTGGRANSYFVARPEFGRTLRATVGWSF